jgi:UDP-glucose 4-epimerase
VINPLNILVTGGAGYIGSHTCITLLEAGHSVIIADNLSNSKSETVMKIMDIVDKEVNFYENNGACHSPENLVSWFVPRCREG